MSDYQRPFREPLNEKMRLIRFRMKKEKLRFADEIRLVPRERLIAVIVLFLVAQIVGQIVNQFRGWDFPPEFTRTEAAWAAMGIITAVAIPIACLIFLIGYVNQDAKRRGMNSTLWTLLVIILLPAWLLTGFVFYFLVREPLPYHCTQCGNTVSARFNYCPNCRYNLRPTCPHGQREAGELDRYCAHGGNDLTPQTQATVQE